MGKTCVEAKHDDWYVKQIKVKVRGWCVRCIQIDITVHFKATKICIHYQNRDRVKVNIEH